MATASLTLSVTDAPWGSPLFFSMEPSVQGLVSRWTPCFPTCHQHCVSLVMTGWGVTPGESLVTLGAQRSFSKRKASSQHVPWSSFGDKQGQFNICPRGTRKQASEPPLPEARETESLGSPDGGGRWSPPRRPKPSRPLFSPAVSFQALQQQQRPSLRGRKNVLAVGVPGEAGGAEGTPVQDPVQNLLAALAVLVSQQGVHERVRCGLAVGQALGQHPPVGADGHRGGQLHQPADRDGEGVH